MKCALILGITGQDGSYLSELLINKNYTVFGIIRRSSSFNTGRINHIFDKLTLRYGDVIDINTIINIINEIKKMNPDKLEIYNLAAQSHVKVSFEVPNYTTSVDGLGTLNILEAIRQCDVIKITKFYQASTSELYGNNKDLFQNENTLFQPQSPYACAKLYSYWITKIYRDSYNIFACNGILFNHESERRGGTFVTKKITQTISDIYNKKTEFLILGNLDSSRDWGHAKDYVFAMWLMLQTDNPDDFVISTGETHTVREFVEEAFKHIHINIIWKGSGLDEVGINKKNNQILVKIDKKYYRPLEVPYLRGDHNKATEKLNWTPKIEFKELVKIMMNHDLNN